MTARQQILRSIRRSLPIVDELPPHEGPWIEYPDVKQQFKEVLESVGGVCHFVKTLSDIPQHLAEQLQPGKVVASGIHTVQGNLDLKKVEDPHDLKGVDFAIFAGRVAVAENSAIWVDDQHLQQRVVYFITQHLSLVVREKDLVSNMHQAYERINIAKSPFGGFIAGPSKTADIEQSLVKGAHGARTNTVFVVEEDFAISE